MTVRLLNEGDAAGYQELRLRSLRENPVAFLSSAADEEGRSPAEIARRVTPAADGSLCVFGAFAGEQLAGILTFVRQPREKVRHAGELCGMYVATEFRRRGLGAALIDSVVAHACSLPGMRQLKLTVAASNVEARALYQAKGFARVGVEPDAICVDGRYYDDEIYILRLNHVA